MDNTESANGFQPTSSSSLISNRGMRREGRPYREKWPEHEKGEEVGWSVA